MRVAALREEGEEADGAGGAGTGGLPTSALRLPFCRGRGCQKKLSENPPLPPLPPPPSPHFWGSCWVGGWVVVVLLLLLLLFWLVC